MMVKRLALALALAPVFAACGDTSSGTPAAPLMVEPQNSSFVVGAQRISVALLTNEKPPKPVTGATQVTVDLQGGAGTFETRPLEDVGPGYGEVPVYVGTARLPRAGSYRMVVHATLKGGQKESGEAVISVVDKAPEITVGAPVPPVRQPLASDPGVKITDIDSGVPPDAWHTTTVADGVAQHRAMLLYLGEPGFCKSRTCGPTVQVLQQVCAQYCDRLLFEHIETNYPAGPDETSKANPGFAAFNVQTEPWIYFVNTAGVVAAAFEGPVTVNELRAAADGTLAGKVPAVDVPLT